MSKIINLNEPWGDNHKGSEVEAFIKEQLSILYSEIAAFQTTPIIVVDDINNVDEPQPDTVYRTFNGNNYSDYMYFNGIWIQMATYDVSKLNPQISYYECNTATNAKVVNAANNPSHPHLSTYSLTLGSQFKVKMTTPGTGACTLNVNGTGAKPLLYDGAAVSATNTWGADEILNIFYDGTSYRACNSEGDAGKNFKNYFYGDLRMLAVGQTYDINEAVQTIDGQLLRMAKVIKPFDISEVISIGSLRVYDQKTYQALKDINAYASTTAYIDGDCAIGSPTKLSLMISKNNIEDGDITIIFGNLNKTITIIAGSSAEDVASTIVSNLNEESNIGWTFSASNGIVTATCNENGDNSGVQFGISSNDPTGVIGTRAVSIDGDEDTATVLTLTIAVGEGSVNVTLGNITQTIDITTSSDAASIAESIAALSFEGWSLSANESVVTAECLLSGDNSSTIFEIESNNFNISCEKTIVFTGSDKASLYSEETGWGALTESQYIGITEIWGSPLTVDEIKASAKQNAIAKDFNEIKDIIYNYSYKTYGEFAGGGSTVTANNVFFFRQATLKNCLLQKIEFTTNYTGTIYIGFMNPANDKFVGKLRSYELSNTNVIDLNIEIGDDAVMLGIGSSKAFLKYSYSSGGGVNSYRYETVANCYDGKSMKTYNRILSNYNWRITTKIVGESMPEKIEEIDTRLTNDVIEINNTLKPIKTINYGVAGVGTATLNYGSAWFYSNYTVSPGQIIESIDLPKNYTGTFYLYFANMGNRTITKVMSFPVVASNHIEINEIVSDSAVLGFAAFDSQLLYGGNNPRTIYYVAQKNAKVGGGLIVYSSARGDINLTITIKEALPTLEERVETLESNSNTISKPYGEINIIPIHGQSLSLGIERSVPAIHTTPILGGLMFNTGIYQVDSGIDKMQGIKPLQEGASTIYGNPNYETSCWGTAEMIKKRIIDKVGDNIQTFYLTCGQNGSSINEQFDSELQVLERTITRVKELFPYKSVKVPCFCYIQGEADQISSMTIETYKQKLEAGRMAIQQIAERVLGQSTPVRCILYQTIRGTYTQKRISQAQMELCRDNEYYAPSTSVSTLIEMKNNDGLHLSNWGEYLLGQYQGIQFVDWIYYGHKNVGVMPHSITINGAVIKIKFRVEYPPLRFVTDWCTKATNYGFSVRSNGANIIASESDVVIIDADTVQITCTQNIKNGDMLYYGMSLVASQDEGFHDQGHHGNLCDSQGELYSTDVRETNNTEYHVALNNYCYSFYEELTV